MDNSLKYTNERGVIELQKKKKKPRHSGRIATGVRSYIDGHSRPN